MGNGFLKSYYFIAAFENCFFFFFFPLVGGREKSLVMCDWQLFRVMRVSCYTAVEHLCSCTQAFGWSRETEIRRRLLFLNLDDGPDCFWKPPCSLGTTAVPALPCEKCCIQMLLGKRCVIGISPSLVELSGTHWIVSASDSINNTAKIIYRKRQD